MKQRLQNMDIDNKRVVLRCDFNVPIKDGKILDDYKIRASLQTIEYLIEHNCKIIILSHLGKVKTEEDKIKNTLEPVANRLNELLNTKVSFSKQTRNYALEMMVDQMEPKQVLLLENTRYEDLDGKRESGNDPQLASYWASLGDVFVLDAFGSCHRAHASTAGIAKYIPSCIGFLVQKEIEALDKYVLNPNRPFTIIMGGAKIDDKLELINKLLPKCDHLLLTGGLANTALKAIGFQIGSSISSNNEETLEKVRNMLSLNKDKILLPFDAIVGKEYNNDYVEYRLINEISINESINDIGNKTIEEYSKIIDNSKTIFVNGTSGIYEDNRFANGTKMLLDELVKVSSTTDIIIGGGDASSSIHNFGYDNKFKYVSTGGGATLEYIINESLPALDAISDEQNN